MQFLLMLKYWDGSPKIENTVIIYLKYILKNESKWGSNTETFFKISI